MPVRKKVIRASRCVPSWVKWLSSRLLPSPAPSQEKTTNWGGALPSSSLGKVRWFGCGPVSLVERHR